MTSKDYDLMNFAYHLYMSSMLKEMCLLIIG